MHDVQELLQSVPAVSVYLLVGVVIGLESLGIPLPGEIVLVSSALLASQHGEIDPLILGACASTGAIIGDSIGYAIGRRGGKPLLTWLGGKFPKHFGPHHVATAERAFERWGMWAVFFGRFVALLRIFAGPLAGVLKMPYWKFLTANVLGGIVWAGGTTAVIYYVGIVAEAWLKRFSWMGLVIAVLFGLGSMFVMRRRARKTEAEHAAAEKAKADTDTSTAADADAAAETGTAAEMGTAADAGGKAAAEANGETGAADGRKPAGQERAESGAVRTGE